MQAGRLGELDDLVARDRQPRAQLRVLRIGERDHRIEPVVAALQLDQNEELARLRRGDRAR